MPGAGDQENSRKRITLDEHASSPSDANWRRSRQKRSFVIAVQTAQVDPEGTFVTSLAGGRVGQKRTFAGKAAQFQLEVRARPPEPASHGVYLATRELCGIRVLDMALTQVGYPGWPRPAALLRSLPPMSPAIRG